MSKKWLLLAATPLILAGCNQAVTTETGDTAETTQMAESHSDNMADGEKTMMEVPEGATEYMVDATESSVAWSGAKAVGDTHTGAVGIKQGSLYKTEDGMIGGSIMLDMTAITNDDLEGAAQQKLLDHFASDDFFSVADYPTATLMITSAEEISPGVYAVVADLTIKGITNSIEFEATVDESATSVTADASFEIDRAQWDIQFGSGSFFEDLGDNLINDEVEFTISLVANAK